MITFFETDQAFKEVGKSIDNFTARLNDLWDDIRFDRKDKFALIREIDQLTYYADNSLPAIRNKCVDFFVSVNEVIEENALLKEKLDADAERLKVEKAREYLKECLQGVQDILK